MEFAYATKAILVQFANFNIKAVLITALRTKILLMDNVISLLGNVCAELSSQDQIALLL
jgi:hypothetical protein